MQIFGVIHIINRYILYIIIQLINIIIYNNKERYMK